MFDPKLFLPTAYVVRQEGYYLTRVCPSVCPHPGGTPARSSGGYPDGVPLWPGLTGGYPTLGTPYPSRTWLGGVPYLGYPPSDLARGYPDRGYPTSVVLDTQWSVCLLRSRRRTFLLFDIFPICVELFSVPNKEIKKIQERHEREDLK